jgi:sulfate adenylyltransferase subunit 1
MICWLSEKPMRPDSKYILRHTTNEVKCVIREIKYKVNINTLDSQVDNTPLELNEIGCIRIRTANPLIFDSYCQNRVTGSLILVDEGTNETLGAGMII